MNVTRRTCACLLVCLIALCVLRAPVAAQDGGPVYDVVIRNGRVLDGAGNPWVAVDVAVRGGRFVRVGRVEGHGRREIDARGKYVSPGWIDVMDHSGRVLPRNGLAENRGDTPVRAPVGCSTARATGFNK